MFHKVVISSLFISFAFGVPLIPCKSNLPMPLQFDVAECDEFPCPMYKNEMAVCNVTFTVPEDMSSIKSTIMAKVGPITTKYPIPDNEVCNFLTNGYCPLEAGEKITYNLQVFINKVFPKVKFEMETTLQDAATGKDFLCFKLIGQVTQRPNIL